MMTRTINTTSIKMPTTRTPLELSRSSKGKRICSNMLDGRLQDTSDGDDLAYQEGHRFADEMPLGRRHGGKGRHGHPDRLNGPGHQHKVLAPRFVNYSYASRFRLAFAPT